MLLIPLALVSTAFGADEPAPGFTLSEIWTHSGWIARTVIIMLVVMLFASIVVSIERLWYFKQGRDQSMALAAAIVSKLEAGDVPGAYLITQADEYHRAYLGGLLRAGLKELDLRFDRHGIHNAERAVDKAIAEENSKFRRGMTILATTGSTAPFVGLFGTTFGVINAFQGMAEAGSGLASISAGISEALITTGVGIGVAVLGVWAFNYFNQRADKVAEELNSAHADFVDWAEKTLLARQENRATGK
jgi:biopolymer transport protein TolQ